MSKWRCYFRVFSTLIMNNEHLHRLVGFKHSAAECRRLLNRLMRCKCSRPGEYRAALWLRLGNNWHHNRVWKCGRWVRNLIDLDQALVIFHYLARLLLNMKAICHAIRLLLLWCCSPWVQIDRRKLIKVAALSWMVKFWRCIPIGAFWRRVVMIVMVEWVIFLYDLHRWFYRVHLVILTVYPS
jgi:hypothetical protein